jgi:hypothetical protein
LVQSDKPLWKTVFDVHAEELWSALLFIRRAGGIYPELILPVVLGRILRRYRPSFAGDLLYNALVGTSSSI